MIGYLGVIALQVACIVHLMRHGRNQIWLTALVFLPVVSAIAYFVVEIVPGIGANRHLRLARARAEAVLDPEREIRAARDALDLADTAANHLRLGDAYAALGRWGEAIPLYQASIRKTAGDIDPRTQHKLAEALYASGAGAEALALLDAVDLPAGQSERDRHLLLRAKTLEHLGRKEEALQIYADVVARLPGEEARCRYSALLLAEGWDRKALKVLEEVEGRMKRMSPGQRLADADMYRWASDTLRALRARS
ncbi:MAG: hypothetical protein WDN24_13785 [Sphingomonas sp.]